MNIKISDNLKKISIKTKKSLKMNEKIIKLF